MQTIENKLVKKIRKKLTNARKSLVHLALAGGLTFFGAWGFGATQAYAQSDWDIIAGIIDLNKNNSKLTYEQRDALRAIEDFARTQGERDFQREITKEGAKQTITINYESGKQAQLVKDESGNHYLLVDGTIYRYNQDFGGQEREREMQKTSLKDSTPEGLFIYSKWVDLNEDGRANRSEFFGLNKTTFNLHEENLCVSFYDPNYKGKVVFRLWDEKGNLVGTTPDYYSEGNKIIGPSITDPLENGPGKYKLTANTEDGKTYVTNIKIVE